MLSLLSVIFLWETNYLLCKDLFLFLFVYLLFFCCFVLSFFFFYWQIIKRQSFIITKDHMNYCAICFSGMYISKPSLITYFLVWLKAFPLQKYYQELKLVRHFRGIFKLSVTGLLHPWFLLQMIGRKQLPSNVNVACICIVHNRYLKSYFLLGIKGHEPNISSCQTFYMRLNQRIIGARNTLLV